MRFTGETQLCAKINVGKSFCPLSVQHLYEHKMLQSFLMSIIIYELSLFSFLVTTQNGCVHVSYKGKCLGYALQYFKIITRGEDLLISNF